MTMRELHSRSNCGIQVRMLWSEQDGGVVVTVLDTKTGDSLVVDVLENDRAMDVFHHPYAHAAHRGAEQSELLAA